MLPSGLSQKLALRSSQMLGINLCPLAPDDLLVGPRKIFSSLSLSSASLLVMSYGPLFRVPCILVAMVGFTKTLTPPEPPITATEAAPSTVLEVILKHRVSPFMIRVCMNMNLWILRTDLCRQLSDHHLGFRIRRGYRHPRLQLRTIRVIEGRLV